MRLFSISSRSGLILLLVATTLTHAARAQNASTSIPRCQKPLPCTKSVADFGAVGDGVTNDRPALRAALRSLQPRDVLCFEESKTYLVPEGLQIFGSLANDWTLDGKGATLKMGDTVPTTPSTYILRVREASGWMINDLRFDGNRDTRSISSSAQANLAIRGGKDFAVCGVTSINSVRDGFYVYGQTSTSPSTFPENGLFRDCVADNSYRNGMSIINGRNLSIIGGEYKNTTGHAPVAGIDIESNVGSYEPGVEGVTVQNATFQGNAGYGIVVSSKGIPDRVEVSRNRFYQNGLGGVFVGGSRSIVTRNLFYDFVRPGGSGVIHLRVAAGTHDTVVSENTLANIDTAKPVIWVSSGVPDGHRISDNCVEGFTGTEAIYIPRGSGISVTGNLINPPNGCPNPLDPTVRIDRSRMGERARTVRP